MNDMIKAALAATGCAVIGAVGGLLYRQAKKPEPQFSNYRFGIPPFFTPKPQEETPDEKPEAVVEDTPPTITEDTPAVEPTADDSQADDATPTLSMNVDGVDIAFRQTEEYSKLGLYQVRTGGGEAPWTAQELPGVAQESPVSFEPYPPYGVAYIDGAGDFWTTLDGWHWQRHDQRKEEDAGDIHCRLIPMDEIRDALANLSQKGFYHAKQSRRAVGHTEAGCPPNRKQRRNARRAARRARGKA
jgi:hypothetical protein